MRRKPSSIDEVTIEQLGQSLANHQESNNQRILVSWLGGEPFQWNGWEHWSSHFVERFQLAVSITTNGVVLGQRHLRAKALRWFDEITISVDGFSIDHDRMRSAPGLFERLIDTIKLLINEREGRRPLIRINSVLTRQNIGRFGDFCEHVSGWGVDELSFNQLGGNDRPEYYPDNRLRPTDVDTLLTSMPSFQSQAANHGMRICVSDDYLNRIHATTNGRRLPISDCSPANQFLFVDENGYIGPCSFTAAQFGVHVRDLADTGLVDLPSVFRREISKRKPLDCSDCHATHVFRKFS